MTTPRATRLGLWAVVVVSAGLLVYLLVFALAGIDGQLPVDRCISPELPQKVHGPPVQPGSLPNGTWAWILVAVCFTGFLGGQLWGHRRAEHHWALRRQAHEQGLRDSPGDTAPPSGTLQVFLIAFFALGVVGLGWEAFAVGHVEQNPALWPVTFFVRCAYDAATLPTLLGALTVSTMVGHWLGAMANGRRLP
jgi:hypothetical protein